MKRILGLLVLALFVATAAMAVGPQAAGAQAAGSQVTAPKAGGGAAPGAAALQKEPYFHGIGFAFNKAAGEGQTVAEIHIAKIVQAGARGGSKGGAGTFIVSGGPDQPPNINSSVNGDKGPVSFVAMMVYGAMKFPMKVIKADLTAFEADIFDPMDLAARDKGLRVPCGHVTFKLAEVDGMHQVAEGTLKIKTPNDKASVESRLLLNSVKPPMPPAGADAGADSSD